MPFENRFFTTQIFLNITLTEHFLGNKIIYFSITVQENTRKHVFIQINRIYINCDINTRIFNKYR